MQAVQQLQQTKVNASAPAQINQSQMDIFQIETATEMFRNLVMTMDTEGRYLILNAIANQLRYPNSHTHYFSFIILYLFAEATQVFKSPDPTLLFNWIFDEVINWNTGNCPRADNKGSSGKVNCQPASSLGITHYFHWADKGMLPWLFEMHKHKWLG